jgi:hypothetical protein
MHNEIGPVVLVGLSLVFSGYGIWELAQAYKATALGEWIQRAVVGTGGVFLGALFVDMSRQILG